MNRSRAAADQQASAWLNHDPTLASLKMAAARLHALQQALGRCGLAPMLQARLQVLREREGVILLGVQGASAAAKIRQQGPTLAACLTQQGWKVNEIRLKVQAEASLPFRSDQTDSRPNQRVLGATTRRFLSQASQEIRSEPLARALQKLARRARNAD